MRGHAITLAFMLVGCGSGGAPIIGGDDIAAFDSGPDRTVPPEAGSDGAPDAKPDVAPFVGGPFLCDQCICDGTQNMCFHSGGGAQPAPIDDGGDDAGFGDASACPDDAGYQGCQPIPIDCLLNPSCACILQYHTPPACTCQVDEGGFRVDCIYP